MDSNNIKEPISSAKEVDNQPVANNEAVISQPSNQDQVATNQNGLENTATVKSEATTVTNQVVEPITLAGKEEVILEVKTKKDRGAWGVIFLFIILIGFIFFMPQLMPYINKFIGQNNNPNPTEKPEKPNKPGKPENKEIFYKLSDNPTITNGDLTLSNIVIAPDVKNNYYVSFDIKNISQATFDFSKKYYLQLYDNSPKLLSRAKIYSPSSLASGSTEQFKLRIKAESAATSQVSLMLLTEEDYPLFTLNHDDEGNQIMTCSFSNQKYIYHFLDYKLKAVDYTNSVLSTDYLLPEEYQADKEKAALEVAEWNGIEGLSALYSDVTSGYTITARFDLKTAAASDINKLKKYELFGYDVAAKVVGFEMGAMGYTCQKDEG